MIEFLAFVTLFSGVHLGHFVKLHLHVHIFHPKHNTLRLWALSRTQGRQWKSFYRLEWHLDKALSLFPVSQRSTSLI